MPVPKENKEGGVVEGRIYRITASCCKKRVGRGGAPVETGLPFLSSSDPVDCLAQIPNPYVLPKCP